MVGGGGLEQGRECKEEPPPVSLQPLGSGSHDPWPSATGRWDLESSHTWMAAGSAETRVLVTLLKDATRPSFSLSLPPSRLRVCERGEGSRCEAGSCAATLDFRLSFRAAPGVWESALVACRDRKAFLAVALDPHCNGGRKKSPPHPIEGLARPEERKSCFRLQETRREEVEP